MNELYSPIEVYPFLQEFSLLNQPELLNQHITTLKKLLQETQEDFPEIDSEDNPVRYLNNREKIFCQCASAYYQIQTKKIAMANLESSNSFEILAMNTQLMDSIFHAVYDFCLEDLPLIKGIQVHEMSKECSYKQRILPEKQEKLVLLGQHLADLEDQETNQETVQMREYYRSIQKTLLQEIADHQSKVAHLKEQLALLENWTLDRRHILDSLVIFARGGYGRGELSFSSDCDVGYCLNTQRVDAGEIELLKQLIIRVEHLLNEAKIYTSHQYFEIDEDLSRFTQKDMLHTIPSILESRVLLGSATLSERLKQRFYEILPYEPYVQAKLNDYHMATQPDLNSMNLKEDFGGLRSLQIPLWIASSTFGVFPSQTVELLALLVQKHVLTPRQTWQLSRALEFFYDLRNFVGAARKFYFDDEVRDAGCHESDLKENVINDNLEKLYLLKKKRFNNFDEFDRFRLRLVNDVQELSRLILRRMLDRNVVRTFSNFQVTVNLRKRRIIEIQAIEGLPQIPLSLIFNHPATILDLFLYIGNSDYDLSFELKDEMSAVIETLTPEVVQANRILIQERFTQIMLAPYVAKALSIMFEIYAPTSSDVNTDTLIGRFIPELNHIRFLLRNLSYHQYTVCQHTLRAVQRAQEELEYLKQHYPELYQYLQPKHILALKWGVLFHDIGKIDPKTKHQVSGTSIAVQALERLGYDDEELFELVSLFIVHHMTVVKLSKTSAYFDQALQKFFEIADRDLIRMILLFLTNISDYTAVSETTSKDTKDLRTFFEETYRVFSEARSSAETIQPIELINIYLDNKKRDLEAATRIDLLINHSLNTDLKTTLFDPLAELNPRELDRLRQVENDIQQYWRYLKLGSLDNKGMDQYTDKLIQTIRQYVSNTTVIKLTSEYDKPFNWFFTAFPNRFILSQPPNMLTQKLLEFTRFEKRSTVSVITTPRGRVSGLIVYVHDHPQILSRVAYAISLKNINIESGKMNKMVFADGRVAYCYYFQVSRFGSDIVFPRELERTILEGSLPVMQPPNPLNYNYNSRLRLEFRESDKKGYEVLEEGGRFVRKNRDYHLVKITAEDAPLVYYKMTETFDWVGVTIQQSLISTTGHQVADYFYVTADDYYKLRNSNFEEILKLRFSE